MQDLSPSAEAYAKQTKKNAPAMKETDADRQVRDRVNSAVGDELRQFIERFEHLAEEKNDIADQQREVLAEAKGRGYSVKDLRKIIAERKRDPMDLAGEEEVVGLYKAELGMA